MRFSAAAGATSAMAACSTTMRNAATARDWSREFYVAPDDPASIPAPPPAHPAAREGFADVPGARIFYWDTGGSGEPMVLLHAATGSAMSWAYQQYAFVDAGYRVIGYSRRGAYRTERAPGSGRGPSAEIELATFVDALNIDRFHLIGTAAGGFPVLSYALNNPARLFTATVACSLAGIQDPRFSALQEAIRAPGFNSMPAEFRELSPSYRAANPEGVKRWRALEELSTAGGRTAPPAASSPTATPPPAAQRAPTLDDLGRIRTPTHFIYGAADLLSPPAFGRLLHAAVPGSKLSIIGETGHSASWEQPRAFNETVLGFL